MRASRSVWMAGTAAMRALRAHEYFLDAAHELAAAAGGVVLCVSVQPWLQEHGLKPAHTHLCPLETDF